MTDIVNRNRRRLRYLKWGLGCGLILLIGPFLYSRAYFAANPVSVHEIPSIPTEVPENSRQLVSVLAFNIAHGRGLASSNWQGGNASEREQRLKRLADLIGRSQADIVVLNEVDFDCSWSNHRNQAQFIAQRSGYKYCVQQPNLGFRILGWTWCFGNAVLSKHPISDAQPIGLPSYSNLESILAGSKQAMACTVQIGQQEFVVCAVHLSPRSQSVRIQSVQQILQATQSAKNLIVAGDFNSIASSSGKTQPTSAIDFMDRHDDLQRSALDLSTTSQFMMTYPADKPDRVIDWIYVPGDGEITRHEVIKTYLSDHRPVLTEFVLDHKQR